MNPRTAAVLFSSVTLYKIKPYLEKWLPGDIFASGMVFVQFRLKNIPTQWFRMISDHAMIRQYRMNDGAIMIYHAPIIIQHTR